jgi:hypothetical protein
MRRLLKEDTKNGKKMSNSAKSDVDENVNGRERGGKEKKH